MSKSVVVSGGAGFIGSHLAESCVKRGYDVTVIDDLSLGDRRNMEKFRSEITFHKDDVRSNSLPELIKGADWIFHEAAVPSVPRSFSDPVGTSSINLLGSINVFQAAEEVNAERVVFASSSSIYGNSPDLPKNESMTPQPESPYAASKLSSEIYARIYAEHFNIDVVGLRYFNVFGPRQNPQSNYAAVIPNFIKSLNQGERPIIYGDGEQSRDFTFVNDVVKANLLAAENGQKGETYNVGYNEALSVNDMLCELQRIVGSQLEPIYEDAREGDVKHSRADADRLRTDTGFIPEYDVPDGLEKTVEWFKSNLDRLEGEN
jgi:UDP-glucose 4-epimerase